jgi:hypothetical protein
MCVPGAPLSTTKDTSPPGSRATRAAEAYAEEAIKKLGCWTSTSEIQTIFYHHLEVKSFYIRES